MPLLKSLQLFVLQNQIVGLGMDLCMDLEVLTKHWVQSSTYYNMLPPFSAVHRTVSHADEASFIAQ